MTTHLNYLSILLDRAKRHDINLSAPERALVGDLRDINSKISELYDTPIEGEGEPHLVEHWQRFGQEVAYLNSFRAVVVARAIAHGTVDPETLLAVCTKEIGKNAMHTNWDEDECDGVDGDPADFLNSCLVLHERFGDEWPAKSWKLYGIIGAGWDMDDVYYNNAWLKSCERYEIQLAYEASIVQRYLEAQAA